MDNGLSRRLRPRASDLSLEGCKLQYHKDVLEKWTTGEKFPPVYIEFGPTSACNHRCIPCYVQDAVSKPNSMSSEVYLRFMKEIGDYGVRAIVLGGCGEPTLHKSTPEAIATAVDAGVDVGMLTNGVPIKEKDIPGYVERLTYMRFSISGGSAESYSRFHRTKKEDWEKVREVMGRCVDSRERVNGKCTLGVYTLLSDMNIDEMENWVDEVKKIGMDYIIIKPPAKGIGKIEFISQVELDRCKDLLDRVEQMGNENFKVQVRRDLFEKRGSCEKSYSRCFGLPFMCAVDSDGSVYACNWYWGNKDFVYGNLNNQTFQEIWQSKKKEEVIDRVSKDGFDFGACGECRQNSINQLLWNNRDKMDELLNYKGKIPPHVNFI